MMSDYEKNIEEQKIADRTGNIAMAILWIFALAVLLGIIYGLIKFVKWAWYS
jgi:hypothetical protein